MNTRLVISDCEVNLLTECSYLKNRISISPAKSDCQGWLHWTAKVPKDEPTEESAGTDWHCLPWTQRRKLMTHVPKICNLIILRFKNKQLCFTTLPMSILLQFFSCVFGLCFCFQVKFILKQPHFGSKKKGRFSLAGWKDTAKVAETTARAGRALTWNGCDCWFSWSTRRRGPPLRGHSWRPLTQRTQPRLCVRSPGPQGAYTLGPRRGRQDGVNHLGGLTRKPKQWTHFSTTKSLEL